VSQGGSTAEQTKEIDKALDQMAAEYAEAQVPSPKAIWRMGNDELMHRVHLLALDKILRERFGVTKAEIELATKQCMLDEMEKILVEAKKAKRDMLRMQLTQGIIAPGNIDPKV